MKYYTVANAEDKGWYGSFNSRESANSYGLKMENGYYNFIVFENELKPREAIPSMFVTINNDGIITINESTYKHKVNEKAGIIKKRDSITFVFPKENFDVYDWIAFMKNYLFENNIELYKEEWIVK